MAKKFYLGERINPQLGTYWVRHGQLTKKDAKAKEKCLYGAKIMHPFETEAEYNQKIQELEQQGKKPQ